MMSKVTQALLVIMAVVTAMAQTPAEATKDLAGMSMEDLMKLRVSSAALHEQSLEDAPASVTVITAEQIRRYGYRTLGEAVSSARGFFQTYDHTYTYIGARGFALPGDYQSRLLLLINGHVLNDNVYDFATWFGNDFPVDLGLVDHIEIVRGPSSAVYGSNGVLATINVVTKRPDSVRGGEVRVDTDDKGERKIQASIAGKLKGGANALVSVSAFNNIGEKTMYFSEFDSPDTNYGRAIRMDGEKGYHALADLTWGNWEMLGVLGDRVKTQPISWGETVFNDPGTRAEDLRGFAELAYTRQLPHDRELRWRVYYDAYRYHGIYHYVEPDRVDDNREDDSGDAVGSKVSYRLPAFGPGHLTIGTEIKIDLRTAQHVYDRNPYNQILYVNRPDRNFGLFAQQEWDLGSRWKLDVGGRLDWSWARKSFLSPRFALIYQPSGKTTYKFLYGRGFRNPSAYEMYFDDGGLSAKANPAVRPESSHTFEVSLEHKFGSRVRSLLSLYRYQMNDLILATYVDGGLQQYSNAERIRASGVEAEIAGKAVGQLEVSASFAIQRAVSKAGWPLANSPGQVGKLRASLPVWRQLFFVSGGVQYLGERRTSDGLGVDGAVVPEATLTSTRLLRSMDLTFGVKNLSNRSYRSPIALTETVDSLTQPGRTFFCSLVWRSAR